MAFSQTDRPYEVTSPLGPDVLLLSRMRGEERLSTLFTFELELLSEDPNIAIADVLGQGMTVRIDLPGDETRYINGIVSQFSYVGKQGLLIRYNATLRPWLWLLTRSADCRIFPGESSVDILKKLAGEAGFSDIDDQVGTPPDPIEYCVQYRESAFEFISRLFEHDGIYYYFKHEDGKHKMVLADGIGSHAQVGGFEQISMSPADAATPEEEDRFVQWNIGQFLQTGVFSHTDYDFTKPKADLATRSSTPQDHAQAEFERYDYPGRYIETTPGENIARTRLQELQAQYEIAQGFGTVRGLAAGDLFELTDHPREALNKNYLILSSSYEVVNPEYETTGAAVQSFLCSVTAMDDQVQFRPPRVTPKPIVQGPQTAVVVGDGDDVWTDEYGRIKVQFHWDRIGANDQDSSCWIRVSQNWAGKNWGGMFLPHIGQEVIVDFLEGDPDQPIVTGRVYNQDNMPPLALPANKLKSIIRDNFGNQLIFDATPGAEHIQLFSPHFQSALELGRSLRLKSEDDYHVTKKKDYFEAVVGFSFQIYIGGKVGIHVGFKADVFAGFGASIYFGSKFDIQKGTTFSYYSGGKYEHSKGFKYVKGSQKEYKHGSDDFTQRSEGKISLDTRTDLALNAGAKDEAIIKMSKKSMMLMFGEDGSETKPAASAEAAAAAQSAISTATIAWLAGAAIVSGASAGISSMFQSDADGVSVDDGMLLPMMAAGFVGSSGLGMTGAIAEESAGFAAAMTKAEEAVGKSKAKQDKTFSRVLLEKSGLKIQVFDSGSSGGPGDAEILINKNGTILIRSKSKGITIDSKKALTIKGADKISIKATKNLELEGRTIILKASTKITASPKLEDC